MDSHPAEAPALASLSNRGAANLSILGRAAASTDTSADAVLPCHRLSGQHSPWADVHTLSAEQASELESQLPAQAGTCLPAGQTITEEDAGAAPQASAPATETDAAPAAEPEQQPAAEAAAEVRQASPMDATPEVEVQAQQSEPIAITEPSAQPPAQEEEEEAPVGPEVGGRRSLRFGRSSSHPGGPQLLWVMPLSCDACCPCLLSRLMTAPLLTVA